MQQNWLYNSFVHKKNQRTGLRPEGDLLLHDSDHISVINLGECIQFEFK